MMAQAYAVFVAFLRGRGALFSLAAIFGITFVCWLLAGMSGEVTLNSETVPMGSEMRGSFSTGFALRAFALFGLAVSFLLVPGWILGDVASGAAAFDLSGPVRRDRYLLGRALGVTLLLAAGWCLMSLAVQAVLLARGGEIRLIVFTGAAVLLLAHLLVSGLITLVRILFPRGRGWGLLLAFGLVTTSWVVALDPLEAYLFDIDPPDAADWGNAWWYYSLQSFFDGAPAGPRADVARWAVRLFPPIANLLSVGYDVGTGGSVWPRLDGNAVPAGALWCLFFWGLAVHRFKRGDVG